VARRIARFGARTGWDALFVYGPHAETIGVPIAELALADPAPYAVRLWDGETRELGAHGPLPVYVAGQLSPAAGAPAGAPVVAVAVNGIVAAMAPTTPQPGGELAFQALIPERLVRLGTNRYDVYVVDGRDAFHMRLAPVRAAA
jgi:hypothetical protein